MAKKLLSSVELSLMEMNPSDIVRAARGSNSPTAFGDLLGGVDKDALAQFEAGVNDPTPTVMEKCLEMLFTDSITPE